jgi:hypothetical protein
MATQRDDLPPTEAALPVSQGSRTFYGFQNDKVDRVSRRTVGFVLCGVGIVPRRYETFSDEPTSKAWEVGLAAVF